MPAKKARQRPWAADADRRQSLRHHYSNGVDGLIYYDLTFNTGHLSVEQGGELKPAGYDSRNSAVEPRLSSAIQS
jgi:hypothetical protein